MTKPNRIQRQPAVVWRGGRALVQNVYTCQHPTHTHRWIYVHKQKLTVRPHPSGRGFVVT
jgi:hypothetical protein